MSDYEPQAGDQVLIRGQIADDGTTVLIAPGVELPVRSVLIETDIPELGNVDGQPASFMMLVFGNDEDRAFFAETFEGWPGVEARDL